jgi:hypothetical protein
MRAAISMLGGLSKPFDISARRFREAPMAAITL